MTRPVVQGCGCCSAGCRCAAHAPRAVVPFGWLTVVAKDAAPIVCAEHRPPVTPDGARTRGSP